MTRRVAVRFTVPACPGWCAEREADHGTEFDNIDNAGGELTREHAIDVGSVTIVQVEHNARGRVSLAPATVHSYQPEREDMTADRARQLAVDLMAAALKVDEINGAG